jgi:hypothetical protein
MGRKNLGKKILLTKGIFLIVTVLHAWRNIIFSTGNIEKENRFFRK